MDHKLCEIYKHENGQKLSSETIVILSRKQKETKNKLKIKKENTKFDNKTKEHNQKLIEKISKQQPVGDKWSVEETYEWVKSQDEIKV
jgi:hypothetical protein